MVMHKGLIHNIVNDAPFIGALLVAPSCSHDCPGCINNHLKNSEAQISDLVDILLDITNDPFDEGIILAGLEWTESPDDMQQLILSALTWGLKVMLYTHMTEDEFKEKFPIIYKLPIWVKFGEYDATKLVDDNIQYGVKLATSNQYIKFLGDN